MYVEQQWGLSTCPESAKLHLTAGSSSHPSPPLQSYSFWGQASFPSRPSPLSPCLLPRCQQCGTPQYISPEMWRRQPYSYSADIWALGCILHEMCSLKPLFLAPTDREIRQKV